MFRKLVDYITLLIKKVVRAIFGSSRKGYSFGRRYEPELPRRIGYDDFKSDWFTFEEYYMTLA
ncbi:MAG: hypothetical protein MJ236_04075 [Clostridia bacterium]|nr:hypothetical protein [Clostridia bacterium]